MSHPPRTGSLVLYKSGPARVCSVGEKIELLLQGGRSKRVRPKDIELLHPGPLADVEALSPLDGSVEEAWELLAEEEHSTLEELAELAFGEYTPHSAWAAWQLVADGLWFDGTTATIRAHPRERVEQERQRRSVKAAEKAEWEGLLERLAQRQPGAEDGERLREVELLAHNRTAKSRILKALGKSESPAGAHQFLLDIGHWTENHNPHPARLALPDSDPALETPPFPEEPRLDLTHLESFAIDDEGSNDPDDAISLDGERLWVHVADAAALAPPGSPLDLEARARAANLYLPERTVHMLPPAVTHQLALGLEPISPALSFGFRLDPQAQVVDLEIHLSQVRVSRLTYAEAEERLESAPFGELLAAARRFRQRRMAEGGFQLDLPEVQVKVNAEGVTLRPQPPLSSREMVTELMLMVGEGVARYALTHALAVPFATQPPPERPERPTGLAEMYAFRRQLRPSQHQCNPEPHAGLGLTAYVRATSPLRRYHDLLLHQQLRAHLQGETPLDADIIAQRIVETHAPSRQTRKGERLSNTHWKLVWLKRNPRWRGEGVVVAADEQRATLLIPELAMETRLRFSQPPPLNTTVELALSGVTLAEQSVRFRLA